MHDFQMWHLFLIQTPGSKRTSYPHYHTSNRQKLNSNDQTAINSSFRNKPVHLQRGRMGAHSSPCSIVSLKSSQENAVRGQDLGVGNIPSSGSDSVTSEELACLLFSKDLASSLEKHHPFQLNLLHLKKASK